MDFGLQGPYVPILASVATIGLAVVVSRKVVPNPMTRAEYVPEARDVVALLVGALGMLISGLLQDEASTWSYFIDLGSFAVGTSLFATSKAGSWPRMVGLFIIGIHLVQVLVTNGNAPFFSLIDQIRGIW